MVPSCPSFTGLHIGIRMPSAEDGPVSLLSEADGLKPTFDHVGDCMTRFDPIAPFTDGVANVLIRQQQSSKIYAVTSTLFYHRFQETCQHSLRTSFAKVGGDFVRFDVDDDPLAKFCVLDAPLQFQPTVRRAFIGATIH